MDETQIDEYLDVIQNMTSALDAQSRELQSVATFLKNLRIMLTDDQFKDLRKLLLNAIKNGHDANQNLLDSVKEISNIIDQSQRPPDQPGSTYFA